MNQSQDFIIEPMPMQAETPQRWLRAVEPIAGESLTSLLGRQAGLWSISLQALLKDVDRSAWRLLPDLDVAPEAGLVARIGMRMGMSQEDVLATTFSASLGCLLTSEDRAKLRVHRWRSSHHPWILPSGWQLEPANSLVGAGGIPFCPLCISEELGASSPLSYRLATTVACPQHKIWLHDRCPTCHSRSSPCLRMLLPERVGDQVGIRCPACPPLLPTVVPTLELADRGTLMLQELILGGLRSGEVIVPQLGTFPTIAFMGGLRFALSAAAWLHEQGISLPPARHNRATPPILKGRGQRKGPFETGALRERILRLKGAAWVLTAPLDRWPLLQQLCMWPNHIPKAWRHPWEGITPQGELMRGSAWARKTERQAGSQDVLSIRAFFDLVEQLGLHPIRVQGLLGNITSRRYQRWRNQPSTRIPLECQRRMELFQRLWGSLQSLFGDEGLAKEWLMKPNPHPLFAGMAPIDGLSGEGVLHRFEAADSMFGGSDDQQPISMEGA